MPALVDASGVYMTYGLLYILAVHVVTPLLLGFNIFCVAKLLRTARKHVSRSCHSSHSRTFVGKSVYSLHNEKGVAGG